MPRVWLYFGVPLRIEIRLVSVHVNASCLYIVYGTLLAFICLSTLLPQTSTCLSYVDFSGGVKQLVMGVIPVVSLPGIHPMWRIARAKGRRFLYRPSPCQ